MRITNNQLVQSQMNVAKALSEQGKISETSDSSQKNQSAFSIGDRLTGTLKSLSGNNVQIDLKVSGLVSVQVNGLSVNLLNTLGSKEILNQSIKVTIELTGTGSHLEGILLEDNLEQGLAAAASKQILTRLNLPINELNLKAVGLLNQYNLEPSSASIKALVDGSISASKLSQFPQETLQKLDIHLTLKEALVQLLKTDKSVLSSPNNQMQSTQQTGNAPLAQTMLNQTMITQINEGLQQPIAVEGQLVKQEDVTLLSSVEIDSMETSQLAILDDSQDQMGKEKTQLNRTMQGNIATAENEMLRNKAVSETKESILKMSEMLSRTDIDKLAVLLKAGMPLTIKNALESDQILFGNNKMSKQLLNVLEAIEKTDFSNIAQDIEAFLVESLVEEDYSNEEQLKKMSQLIKQLQDTPEASELKEALGQVKNSMEFIKEINQNMVFVQLPVKVDDTMSTVDLFVKKRKSGSSNQDELKILLALNTETTGNVQAFIDWNKDRLKLTFKLDSDEWVQLYKTEVEPLQESLKSLSGRPVFIESYLKTAGSPIEAFLVEETSGQGIIDYRV